MPDARIEIEAEDAGLDAFIACPDGPGRRRPLILLGDREGLTPALETRARRFAACGYYVLAPDWARRGPEDRREDADAWLDHLADARDVDDARVGLVGLGAGANLALRLAAWRAERIAAVAAFGPRGFGPSAAREIAQRINGVVRLGWPLEAFPATLNQRGGTRRPLIQRGRDFPDWLASSQSGKARGATSARIGVLETALCAAGVDFDVEIWGPEPDWSGLIDLFGRTLGPESREQAHLTDVHLTPYNP